ncbi:MAG: hypothetical protein MR835_00470 [Erysipelotrichaceae bacterium]|nr:hypothetical protein [Erysipelotrichaceae bacterium]
MLELLLVWLGITGMVEGVNYSVYFKLINSIYSSGYKINYNNLLQCSEYFSDNHKYQNIFGKMLIPLVNAKYVNAKSVYFSKNIGKIIDKLALYGIVEGMSLEEYAEYLNKSCVDTALNITFPSREEKIEFLKYLFVEMNKVITLDENEKVNTLILSDDTVIRYTLSEENNQKRIKVINSNLVNAESNALAERLVKDTYIMLGYKAKTGELDLAYLSRYLKENNGVLDLREFNLVKSKIKK